METHEARIAAEARANAAETQAATEAAGRIAAEARAAELQAEVERLRKQGRG